MTINPLKSAANDTTPLLLFNMTDETPRTLVEVHSSPRPRAAIYRIQSGIATVKQPRLA
jgi:hypothetical protein